jgi:transposase
LGRTVGGLNTKLHVAVVSHGLPVRMIVTAGTIHDVTQARALIEAIPAQNLLADKAYDDDKLRERCKKNNIIPVIPPRSNRKNPTPYDKHLYKLRHLVEKAFLKLKQWRSIATRYAKTTKTFLAECQIAAIMLWMR